MLTITTKDGTTLSYKDWGTGRRGHGLSGQPWAGHEMDTFAFFGLIAPPAASAPESVKLLKRSTLKVYQGADPGLMSTQQDRFNADLSAFVQS